MTLPKGAVWQVVRQRAIETIPPGTTLNFRHSTTLGDWQRTGAYIVTLASPTKLSLIAPSLDVGSVLLSDAQFQLDQAAEHQATMWHDLRSGQWNSPAWLTVTFYYWGYFLAMAFSRLLGNTVWFVNEVTAAQLSTLSPLTGKIGAGTYEFCCEPTESATDRVIALTKRSRRVHEQLWLTTFSLLKAIHKAVPKGSADPIEDRFYLAILNTVRRFGSFWPSELRNLVNYRPKFAYDAIRAGNVLDSYQFLRIDRPHDVEDVIGRLETNTIEADRANSVSGAPRLAAHMLVDMTILLQVLVRSLHDELIDRHGLDRRWSLRRNAFAARNGLVFERREWPC